jgi:hypothetical protein
MPSKPTSRSFDSISVPGLSSNAREAVNAAFDAMSTWRNEASETSEKNSKRVIEKMSAAATALGWPEQIVDAVRTQMQSVAEAQIKMMDNVMDAWEEQLKSPNPMTANPLAMLSKLKSSSPFGSVGSWPSANSLQSAAMNPLQFWKQYADQWEKSWTDMMGYWTKMGRTTS